MKTLLTITVMVLLLWSCKKDEQKSIPSNIYGTYNATIHKEPGNANYINTLIVKAHSSSEVKMIFHHNGLDMDSLIVEVDDNSLTIHSQSYQNTGNSGGMKTYSGSGTFSNPQITMNYGLVYNATQPPETYNYSLTASKQ